MATKLTVVEISPSLSAGDAAALIQKHRVLVLVNLNGWTLHDRNDVFALQPSPVQVQPLPPPPPGMQNLRLQHPLPPSLVYRLGGWATLQPPAAAT